jgi:hypothetical protein
MKKSLYVIGYILFCTGLFLFASTSLWYFYEIISGVEKNELDYLDNFLFLTTILYLIGFILADSNKPEKNH